MIVHTFYIHLYINHNQSYKMKRIMLFLMLAVLAALPSYAQRAERFIEVTGTSEVELVPDKVHYIIEIKEYFEEEFDGVSKPENYKTKVTIAEIERELLSKLRDAGVDENSIRTEEVGNYHRAQKQDFLVMKRFDVQLDSFEPIDRIVKTVDSKGINSMYIGELESYDLQTFRRKGKIEALKAAREKAEYLAEAAGAKIGRVISIVEEKDRYADALFAAQSNVGFSDASGFGSYRTIKRNYSMLVRFELKDK